MAVDELKCWANVDKSSGEGDSSFHILCDRNNSDETQTAVIEVVSEDGSIVREITIKQEPRKVYKNVRMQKEFTRNDCAANEKGTKVLYVVPEGQFISYVSQQDADDQAERDILLNGQNKANEEGRCEVYIWYNARISKIFTRNDCPDGATGSSVEYVVEAGSHSSLISQADADAKAQNDIDTNGQNYANQHGTCSGTYYNVRKSGNFQKNDCTTGTGSFVEYVVEAGTISSSISQADADAKAQAKVDSEGQAYANQYGTCTSAFYNSKIETRLQKNDCTEGVGEFAIYIVEAGKYSSEISQEDADAKAQKDSDDNAQSWVNQNAGCVVTYTNVEKRKTFTRNNCTGGTKGTQVEYVIEAGKYSSNISQADADAKAENEINEKGQDYANEYGECLDIFISKAISKEFQKECTNGMIGSKVTYSVEAGKYASDISQEDADRQAQEDVDANGQSYANKNGVCMYGNDAMSQEFQKECPSGMKGTKVMYEVEANKYTSLESKAAANALAEADIATNGQVYANEHGTCEDMFLNVAKSKDFQKNDCDSAMVGSTVTYVVDAGKYSSDISQADADAKADRDITENGQAYANKNGTCLYGNVRKSKTFTKVCPEGQQGTDVEYVVEAKKYTSSISQADADAKADKDIADNGQAYANEHGSCQTKYYNVAKSKTFTRNNCPGGQTGGEVVYTVEAGKHMSLISQADADAKADKDIADNGQNYANQHGSCLYLSARKQGTFYKDDCGSCKHGDAYVYVVEAGRYTSETSQADADAKAQKDVNDNGQDSANKNGTCSSDSATPTWTDTGTTRCNGCTSQKEQRDTNPCSTSYNTTKYINGGSRDCSEAGSWGSWTTGSCSGCTYERSRTNTCGGVEYDTQNNSENCGSWGSWSDTGRCSGTASVYQRTHGCSGRTETENRYINNKCGYCSDYTATGTYKCVNNASQQRWVDGCGNEDWRPGGTACEATNNQRYCKSGCECDTCVGIGEVSASGSTTSSAQTAANTAAQNKANSMTCISMKSWQASAITTKSLDPECGVGCTSGGKVSVPTSIITGTHKACDQASANTSAQSEYDSKAQAYANEKGKCNCVDPCEVDGTIDLVHDVNAMYRLTVKLTNVHKGDCSGKGYVTVTLTGASFENSGSSNIEIVNNTNNEVAYVSFTGPDNIINGHSIRAHDGYTIDNIRVVVSIGAKPGITDCNCQARFYYN